MRHLNAQKDVQLVYVKDNTRYWGEFFLQITYDRKGHNIYTGHYVRFWCATYWLSSMINAHVYTYIDRPVENLLWTTFFYSSGFALSCGWLKMHITCKVNLTDFCPRFLCNKKCLPECCKSRTEKRNRSRDNVDRKYLEWGKGQANTRNLISQQNSNRCVTQQEQCKYRPKSRGVSPIDFFLNGILVLKK